jgi:hypothetical protein
VQCFRGTVAKLAECGVAELTDQCGRENPSVVK